MRRKSTSPATLRTCRLLAPNCPCASGVSGFVAHAFDSGQIGSPVLTTLAQTAHFRKSPASLPVFLQIGGPTRNRSDSSINPAVTRNPCMLNCPARLCGRRLRSSEPSRRIPQPARLPVKAIQRVFPHHARVGIRLLEACPTGPNEKKTLISSSILKPQWTLGRLAQPDLTDQARRSDVIQDSDFPWEIAERFFDSQKISALRASGALRVNLFSFYQRSTSAA
jgi:hypothetical protein